MLSAGVPSTVTWAVPSRTVMPARRVCPTWNALEATRCSELKPFPELSSIPSRISFSQNEAT
jgi:hypothetical protein